MKNMLKLNYYNQSGNKSKIPYKTSNNKKLSLETPTLNTVNSRVFQKICLLNYTYIQTEVTEQGLKSSRSRERLPEFKFITFYKYESEKLWMNEKINIKTSRTQEEQYTRSKDKSLKQKFHVKKQSIYAMIK